MNISIDSHKLIVYKLSICTKYYKTQVLLYECNDINSIPNGIKNKIEGAIFYFDANDVSIGNPCHKQCHNNPCSF